MIRKCPLCRYLSNTERYCENDGEYLHELPKDQLTSAQRKLLFRRLKITLKRTTISTLRTILHFIFLASLGVAIGTSSYHSYLHSSVADNGPSTKTISPKGRVKGIPASKDNSFEIVLENSQADPASGPICQKQLSELEAEVKRLLMKEISNETSNVVVRVVFSPQCEKGAFRIQIGKKTISRYSCKKMDNWICQSAE